MDICLAYKTINKTTLDVAKSLNVLQEVKVEEKRDFIRLEESTFVLSEETDRYSQVVSAHDLHQYKNRFYSIRLEEDMSCWLDILLSIDKGVEIECY